MLKAKHKKRRRKPKLSVIKPAGTARRLIYSPLSIERKKLIILAGAKNLIILLAARRVVAKK